MIIGMVNKIILILIIKWRCFIKKINIKKKKKRLMKSFFFCITINLEANINSVVET